MASSNPGRKEIKKRRKKNRKDILSLSPGGRRI
jgi:ribosomal protein L34